MKIGFISDTHGSLAGWNNAVSGVLQECDLIIHCGDVLNHGPRNPLPDGYDPLRLVEALNCHPQPVLFCRGNCDADIDGVLIDWPLLSPYAFFQSGTVRLMAMHQKPDGDVERIMSRQRLNLLVYGHTHVSTIEETEYGLLLNPGSVGLPRDGYRSAAVLDGHVMRVFDLDSGNVLHQGCLPVTGKV